MNSLEKTWNVFFTPLAQLFSPLPLNFLDNVFLSVCFIHLSVLQHPVKRGKILKSTERTQRTRENVFSSPALLTFGLGAGGCP